MRLLSKTRVAWPGNGLLQVRYRSTSSSVVNITDIPAPHCGNIKILSLNRPNACNAISSQLLAELGKVIHFLHHEGANGPTRALIIASDVDNSFCAGADLKERKSFTPDQTSGFLTALRATFSSISRLPIPTVTALSSMAFGGGLELALATHFRVFASTAVVSLPETRLGIIPGAGATYRLPALIGLNRARDLILTGRRVDGNEAYFLGLCDRLVQIEPKDSEIEGFTRKKVLEEAVKVSRDICEGAPLAASAAIRAISGCTAGEGAENRAYDDVMRTQDRNEALLAFSEKRSPVFKGR